ncbi:MAG TPA: FGGY family carbohydrate kinase [Baekduia sp.]|nr:FGGY family carbohydrate kinase [Baekduia sp.]
MRASCWLGLDFGTSSVKALLVDSSGAVRGRAGVAYPSSYGRRGEAEQDPSDYLRAAREAIARCGAAEADVGGVGLAGQTPTLLAIDRDGEAVRPALTWQDHRAEAEAAELAETFGSGERLFGTRLPWTAAYAPAKLLWLARHEHEHVARARWLLQPKDFVGFRLTGAAVSDPWSSKGLANVLTRAPVAPLFEHAGVAATAAPPLADAWERRGTVTAKAAEEFGLTAGTPVSVGWSDALAAMLAVGAFDAPTGFVLTGTSSIVGLSTADAPAGAASDRLLEIPTACAPLSVAYGPTESSGASLTWLATLLGMEVPDVLELAASAPPRADSPIFVPYLAGERAPVWRTDVRGGFLGLSADDGPADIARAVVLGVCLSELDVLSVAEEHLGARATEVRVGGRGAGTPPWSQARLATLGRPMRVLEERDASALGAAMLGAAAAHGELAAARALRGHDAQHEPLEAGSSTLLEAYREAAQASLAWSDRRIPWS